jgi:hypothetical protein
MAKPLRATTRLIAERPAWLEQASSARVGARRRASACRSCSMWVEGRLQDLVGTEAGGDLLPVRHDPRGDQHEARRLGARPARHRDGLRPAQIVELEPDEGQGRTTLEQDVAEGLARRRLVDHGAGIESFHDLPQRATPARIAIRDHDTC